MNRALPYLISAAALVAIVFLALAALILNTARLNTILSSTAEHLDAQTTSNPTIYNDPLITYVPNGERSAQQKTNVFVSSQDPLLGTKEAKVYVILYGSLLDETMQDYLSALPDIQAGYAADQVALVWKDNADTDLAHDAAEVGHCANTVGRFWEYAKALSSTKITDLNSLKQVAIAQGVNSTELDDCLLTSGVSAQVDQSVGLASPLGVVGTHSVFINDHLLTDATTADQLKQTIDEVLASF